jgi:hypothetical protein
MLWLTRLKELCRFSESGLRRYLTHWLCYILTCVSTQNTAMVSREIWFKKNRFIQVSCVWHHTYFTDVVPLSWNHRYWRRQREKLFGVCFLLGSSPASEFYMPMFQNTLSHLHRQVGHTYPSMKMEQTECFKTLGHKIQMPGNYPEENIQNTAKVWIQEKLFVTSMWLFLLICETSLRNMYHWKHL